jgi:hypothetical protein
MQYEKPELEVSRGPAEIWLSKENWNPALMKKLVWKSFWLP